MDRQLARRAAAMVLIVLVLRSAFADSLAAQTGHSADGAAPARPSGRPAATSTRSVETGSVEGDIYFGLRGPEGLTAGAATDFVRLIPADALRRVGEVCRSARAKSDSLSALSDRISAPLRPLARDQSITPDELRRIADERSRVEVERTEVQREAARHVRALLLESAAAEMRTGMSAHYRLTDVRPGEYAVWAEGVMGGDAPLDWIARVTVRPGKTAVRDLDSSADGSTTLYCGFTVRAHWLQ